MGQPLAGQAQPDGGTKRIELTPEGGGGQYLSGRDPLWPGTKQHGLIHVDVPKVAPNVPCAFTGAERQVEGKFELAHRGTLFLDEIADLSIVGQAKILRAVEDGEFERLGGALGYCWGSAFL